MSLKKHLDKLHNRISTVGSLDFQCEHKECGKTFKDRYLLERHQNLHRNILEKCYFCPWTGNLRRDYDATAHYDRHLLHPRFKCPHCEKAFFRKQELQGHVEAFHERTVGRYKCKSCEFTTHSRTYLSKHVWKMHKK